jgi:hypothetical protein
LHIETPFPTIDRALARVLKQNTPTWKPFDPDQPLKRVKWDRKFHPILSARAYIMELLGNALKSAIKKTLSPGGDFGYVENT